MKRSKRIKNASNQNHNSNQEEYSSSCSTNGSQSIASTIRKRKKTTQYNDLCDSQSSHQSRTSRTSNTSMYKKASRHNASKSSPVSNVSNKNNYKTKTYICVGCNRRYSQFKSPSQFIKNHMETNIRCKKAIVYCQCCKSGFIDKLSLMSHLNKSNKSCRKFYDQKAISDSIASSFSTSEVIIMSHSDKQSEEILSKSLSTVNGTKHNTNISVGQSMFLRTAVTKHSIKSLKKKVTYPL